jgi:hypothetical protein
LKAYSQILWDIDGFSVEKYLDEYANLYGEEKETAKQFVKGYFDNLPTLPTEYLRYVHAKYFNYNYQEIPPEGIKNFILKDELVMVKGSEIVWYFKEEPPCPLHENMYVALKKAIPIYEELTDGLQIWMKKLPCNLQRHVTCKWWLHAKTLLHFYRFFVYLYEGKLAYDGKDGAQAKEKLRAACEALEEYLAFRKCAEYGEFANWYRGDKKVNVEKRLLDTKALLEKKC